MQIRAEEAVRKGMLGSWHLLSHLGSVSIGYIACNSADSTGNFVVIQENMITLKTVKSFLLFFFISCVESCFSLPCITYCAVRCIRQFSFIEKEGENDFVLIFFPLFLFSP